MCGHCSCHLSSPGCAGRSSQLKPAELMAEWALRDPLPVSGCSPGLSQLLFHGTAQGVPAGMCRKVLERSLHCPWSYAATGVFPTASLHSQTLKQTSAVRFKPQKTQLMLSLSSVVTLHSLLPTSCCSVLGRSWCRWDWGGKSPTAPAQCCLLVLKTSPCLPGWWN